MSTYTHIINVVAPTTFSGVTTAAFRTTRDALALHRESLERRILAGEVIRFEILPIGPEPLDDDTGAPIVRPAYVVLDGNAYWREPAGRSFYLMTAPISFSGHVVWEDEYEVEILECPAYGSILETLAHLA